MSVEERLRGLEQYRDELRNAMDVYPNAVNFKLPVSLSGNKSISYTPTWTASTTDPDIGDGTITGNYARIGPLIVCSFNITMGASTTFGTGTWRLSLPKGAVYIGAGSLWLYDRFAAQYTGSCRLYSASVVELCGPTDVVTATYPFTWTSSDMLRGTVVYFA